jgi:hypothetical protein
VNREAHGGGPALLHAAQTLRGGWFGDEAAEALATGRRSRRPAATKRPANGST